ncbi:MAG: YqgE/AlgH family protein [Gammaproteobacteria bacterium]|nr:YqgE/AlgH family protein [Gammaproteobacteria bacterium]
MTDSINLTNHLLIAMPQLADGNFYRSVTYICEHNDSGAMGVIINKPTNLHVSDILNDMSIPCEDSPMAGNPVLLGGPVQTEQGFVLHSPLGSWDSTLKVTDNIGITTSKDVLSSIADNQGPSTALVFLGYAGWGEGQLEKEIMANSWLTIETNREILFETAYDKRWEAAAHLLGIDISMLSSDSGHA